MKTFIAIAASLLAVTNVHARDNRSFVNIGVKLSQTFGDLGGFTYGFEISTTTIGDDFGAGILASTDVCRDRY